MSEKLICMPLVVPERLKLVAELICKSPEVPFLVSTESVAMKGPTLLRHVRVAPVPPASLLDV